MILSLLTAGVARLPNRLFGLVFSMVSGGRCLSLPLRARLSGVWYLRIRMLRLLAYNVNPCCSNLDPLNVNLRLGSSRSESPLPGEGVVSPLRFTVGRHTGEPPE